MKTYNAMFTPFVTVTVAEHDDGHVEVVSAEVDWSDTFQNLSTRDDEKEDWLMDPYTQPVHPAAEEAMRRLDLQLARDESGASALRLIADLIDGTSNG